MGWNAVGGLSLTNWDGYLAHPQPPALCALQDIKLQLCSFAGTTAPLTLLGKPPWLLCQGFMCFVTSAGMV